MQLSAVYSADAHTHISYISPSGHAPTAVLHRRCSSELHSAAVWQVDVDFARGPQVSTSPWPPLSLRLAFSLLPLCSPCCVIVKKADAFSSRSTSTSTGLPTQRLAFCRDISGMSFYKRCASHYLVNAANGLTAQLMCSLYFWSSSSYRFYRFLHTCWDISSHRTVIYSLNHPIYTETCLYIDNYNVRSIN